MKPLNISPLLLCEGLHEFTPTHNTSGLGAPVSPSVITLLVEACWCVSLPQQHRSCVWYSVGGIHCSALKFMDQVRWLPSTAVCYNIVTLHLLTSRQYSAPSCCSGCKHLLSLVQVTWNALNAKLTRLLCAPPPSEGIHRGIWNTRVFLFVSDHHWAVFTVIQDESQGRILLFLPW